MLSGSACGVGASIVGIVASQPQRQDKPLRQELSGEAAACRSSSAAVPKRRASSWVAASLNWTVTFLERWRYSLGDRATGSLHRLQGRPLIAQPHHAKMPGLGERYGQPDNGHHVRKAERRSADLQQRLSSLRAETQNLNRRRWRQGARSASRSE